MSSHRAVGIDRRPGVDLQLPGGDVMGETGACQLLVHLAGVELAQVIQVLVKFLLLHFRRLLCEPPHEPVVAPPNLLAGGQAPRILPLHQLVVGVPIHVKGRVPAGHLLPVVGVPHLADLLVRLQAVATPLVAELPGGAQLVALADPEVVLPAVPLVGRPHHADPVAHGDTLVVLCFKLGTPGPGGVASPDPIYHPARALVEGVPVRTPVHLRQRVAIAALEHHRCPKTRDHQGYQPPALRQRRGWQISHAEDSEETQEEKPIGPRTARGVAVHVAGVLGELGVVHQEVLLQGDVAQGLEVLDAGLVALFGRAVSGALHLVTLIRPRRSHAVGAPLDAVPESVIAAALDVEIAVPHTSQAINVLAPLLRDGDQQ
mmetsp:Transcript_118426/g.281122  ORF Transcript_118426/g.281122 Transcript_118426/m.281122 type:complete len:374 (+) Transcript_118426:1028-2149(+)